MAEESLNLYKKIGLSDFEFEQIKLRLQRTPNELETYLFSAMWSEHCGYKHSKRYLNLLPSKNAVCPEENSGGIEVGNHVIFFKAESHNHPSAVEPYQGAATGIGGIIRDILTLGARPIALLDSLKFGDLSKGKNKYLLDGVVKGIAGYGNCIGVPTIGGETGFDDCYNNAPLVNVMAIGLIEKSKIKKSAAEAGGIVLLMGSDTGRDGIHGASFASKELEDKKEDKLSVQIADPFTKKNVIEATLEILDSDAIIAAQDCGAAGLLSSTSEMAYKGSCGMELYLDRVHLREKNMQPWEIMLSESQERMVFIVKPSYVKEVERIAQKYDIALSEIGKTIKEKEYRLFFNDEMLTNIAPEVLNDCITYELNIPAPPVTSPEPKEEEFCADDIIRILKSPDIASKKYIYSQYDYTVGNRTTSKPEKTSAGCIWIKEENKFAAFTFDSMPRQAFLNPFEGSKGAVYEAARNLIAAGFEPKGITDCLNFANPENEKTAYQFINSIKGMAKACEELDIPVVSGNVSFYNEGILPTAAIGMIGLSDENIRKNNLSEGDYMYLIGKDIQESSNIGGSLYHKIFYNTLGGEIDTVNKDLELKLKNFILKNKFTSCNDVSEGGLFVSLFELLHAAGMGFRGNLINIKNARKALFGEITGRYIVSASESLEEKLKQNKIPFRFLGRCKKNKLEFNSFSFNIEELRKIYETSFEMELNS